MDPERKVLPTRLRLIRVKKRPPGRFSRALRVLGLVLGWPLGLGYAFLWTTGEILDHAFPNMASPEFQRIEGTAGLVGVLLGALLGIGALFLPRLREFLKYCLRVPIYSVIFGFFGLALGGILLVVGVPESFFNKVAIAGFIFGALIGLLMFTDFFSEKSEGTVGQLPDAPKQ